MDAFLLFSMIGYGLFGAGFLAKALAAHADDKPLSAIADAFMVGGIVIISVLLIYSLAGVLWKAW